MCEFGLGEWVGVLFITSWVQGKWGANMSLGDFDCWHKNVAWSCFPPYRQKNVCLDVSRKCSRDFTAWNSFYAPESGSADQEVEVNPLGFMGGLRDQWGWYEWQEITDGIFMFVLRVTLMCMFSSWYKSTVRLASDSVVIVWLNALLFPKCTLNTVKLVVRRASM